MRDRDHQRNRCDDQHQRRNHQAGDAEKGDDGLALARHQVDAAQRLRNPDHARQARPEPAQTTPASCGRCTCRSTPSLPHDPTLRARRTAFDQPLLRVPHGRAGKPSSPLLSHYHPFDPSTKWPGHGTLTIWLIIHLMWPPGHAGAWQRGASQAIVAKTRGLEVILGRCHREHFNYPGAPATA